MIHVRFNRWPSVDVQHAPNSRISRHGIYLVGPRWAYLLVWFWLPRSTPDNESNHVTPGQEA